MTKKLLFSVFALVLFGTVLAQIQLDQNDYVIAGKDVTSAYDTLPGVAIAEGGTGLQTWDFSMLNNHGLSANQYVDPSTTPYATTFPTATICSETGATYGYNVVSASSVTRLGIHIDFVYGTIPISITLKNSPAEKLFDYPATYNSSFISDFTTSGKTKATGLPFGADSAKIKSVNHKTVVYDAYGNMTTPLGTFATIRAKEVNISTDTVWARVPFLGWQVAQAGKDTTTTYIWYGKNLGGALVSANYNDSLGKIDYVTWLYDLAAGVNEMSAVAISKTYPTPANDLVYIENNNPTAKQVVVMDINGKLLINQQLDGKVTLVSTKDLPSGFYIYSLQDGSNTVLDHGRVIVTH